MHGVIVKPEHGSIEWLQARHRDEEGMPVISASDAACVHGEHRYKSLYQFCQEKMADDVQVTETNEAMERGNRLEPMLIDWVGDKIGRKLRTPQKMYVYKEPGVSLIATLDAVDWTVDIEQGLLAPAVVEIKTTNRVFDPEAPLPAMWFWQGVQQAICADVNKIIWGVFDSTLTLHIVEQVVTSDAKRDHIDQCRNVTSHLMTGDIPNEWAQTIEDLRALEEDPGTTTEIDSVETQLRELIEVQAEARELKKREDDLKVQIGVALGTASVGTINGKPAVTWKTQSRSGFDNKRFAADHPDMAEQYTTTSSFRVMRFPK